MCLCYLLYKNVSLIWSTQRRLNSSKRPFCSKYVGQIASQIIGTWCQDRSIRILRATSYADLIYFQNPFPFYLLQVCTKIVISIKEDHYLKVQFETINFWFAWSMDCPHKSSLKWESAGFEIDLILKTHFLFKKLRPEFGN